MGGGKCAHKDKAAKLFSIGAWPNCCTGMGLEEKKAALIAELEKCITLCAICHRLVEYDQLSTRGMPTVEVSQAELTQFNYRICVSTHSSVISSV